MKVFIFGQRWRKENQSYVELLFKKLDAEGIEYKIHSPFARQSGKLFPEEKLLDNHIALQSYNPDYIITLGGDGTILSAVLLIRDMDTPIMGINLGRLGFLASTLVDAVGLASAQMAADESTLHAFQEHRRQSL